MVHRLGAWNCLTWEIIDVGFEYLITNVWWLALKMFLLISHFKVVILHFHGVEALLGTRQSENLRRKVFLSRGLSSWRTLKLPHTVAFSEWLVFDVVDIMRLNMSFACTCLEFRFEWLLFMPLKTDFNKCDVSWLLLLLRTLSALI